MTKVNAVTEIEYRDSSQTDVWKKLEDPSSITHEHVSSVNAALGWTKFRVLRSKDSEVR